MTQDTRVDAKQTTWHALRFACENTSQQAVFKVLKEAGVKLLNKSIQMCYDDSLHRYDIPVFIINDPSSYEIAKVEEVSESKDLKVASY